MNRTDCGMRTPYLFFARAWIEFLKARIEAGEYRAVIDRHYTLDEIVEAYRYVETGQKVGNVVIDETSSEL